jgi:hypothetical protein
LYAKDNLIKGNVVFWSDLLHHNIKLVVFCIKNNIKILESYKNFLTKLKRTKSNIERIGWRLGNQDGIVKIA